MAKKNKKVDEEKILGEEMETVTEVIVPSDEEKILGATDEVVTRQVVDYTSIKRRYKVHNLKRNRVYELNGYQIGAILGINEDARQELKEGALNVVIDTMEEVNGKFERVELYKIEVIK